MTQRVLTVTPEVEDHMARIDSGSLDKEREKEFIIEMKQDSSLVANGDEMFFLRFFARILLLVIFIPIMVIIIL